MGIGFTSEFVPVKEVRVVGALPKEIEFVNEYSAYIPATSAAAVTAQALLAYLARPASRDIFKPAGAGLWGPPLRPPAAQRTRSTARPKGPPLTAATLS